MTTRQLFALTWGFHVLLIVVLTFVPEFPDGVYLMVQAVLVIRVGMWAGRAWRSAA